MIVRTEGGRSAGLLAISACLAFACTADMKARGYAAGDRDAWQQPERVIGDLGLRAGMKVADLGAGGGYFSFRLAEGVGPSGRVYAVDVDAAMNERLERIAAERGVNNLVTVLAGETTSNLPEPVDLVFTSNTYHHLPDRLAYFERLKKDLRPSGRVAIVEFHDEGFMSGLLGHGTSAALIERELGEAGYVRVADFGYLERQSFSIFRPE